MSTINCIFILLVWYNTILTPYIEAEKAKLEQEYRWEEERLYMANKKAMTLAGSIILNKFDSTSSMSG